MWKIRLWKDDIAQMFKSVLTPNGDKAGEVLFENKKLKKLMKELRQ